MMKEPKDSKRRLLLAMYPDLQAAEAAVTLLQREDFPMDRVSLLGRALGRASDAGDDPVGFYYPQLGQRVRGWGKHGALWGSLWGLLAGAAGVFLLPGVGPLIAAGPLVETLVGAAAGAGIGGGVMAGAGAAAHLSTAVHRMGIPRDEIDHVVDAIHDGMHLVMLIVPREDAEDWSETLAMTKPRDLRAYPYPGLTEAVAAAGSRDDER